MRILSKALIFSFFLLSIFYLLPSSAYANTTPQANNYPIANTNPDVPPRNPATAGNVVGTFQPQADYVPNNLHNWTQNVMIEVMSALTCQLAGVDPINPKQGCLGIDSKSGKIGFLPSASSGQANGGAIGFMGNMIATLYTPPLHTSDYFQNLAQNFIITKQAYAQNTGTGFQGLTPLIGIWSAFRNIVYLLLVIVFIVIGLAIMLRIKIDPRTVMSIQNQIPKIIIGILVVTFSFAIAGFLIDMMWVFIYLIFGIFSGISPEVAKSVSGLNPTVMQGSNPFGALGAGNIWDIIFNSSKGVGGLLGSILGGEGGAVGSGVGLVSGATIGGILGSIFPVIGNIIGAVAGGLLGLAVGAFGTGNAVGFIGGIIAFLIILIALLVALFRLWFTLIMAYVHILIDVVLAPFWIIGGIVPGSPISLTGWLRDIVANLAAFPATIGMFMLGKVFMDAFGECPAESPNCAANNFVPPLIGNAGEPSLIGSLIGLGIILMTPNVVNMLKTALKAPKIDTGGAFKALGAGAGAPMGIFRTGGNIGSTLFGLSNIPGVNRIPFLSKIKGGGHGGGGQAGGPGSGL